MGQQEETAGSEGRPLRVLVTGSRGQLGRWISRQLKREGYAVSGFDLRDGQDMLRRDDVFRAVAASDVVVHAAAAQFRAPIPAEDLFRTNVEGTANVLAAAEAAGHGRVIVFSSCQVLGIMEGHGVPVSFPIRDSHPRMPVGPYGASKVAVEDECERFSERTGIATVCFRPAHVWVPGLAGDRRRLWARNPSAEFEPVWNYGTFVDVRDVCNAVSLALTAPLEGHHRLLLCAEDIASTMPALEAVRRVHPGIAVEPDWAASAAPDAALFDTSPARDLLEWEPRFTWRDGSNETWAARLRRRLRQPFPV